MKEEHPIEGLMLTAMSSIRDMVDVNTIIGEPIQSIDGMIIIPISKVSFGFAAGGSEFTGETVDKYSKKEKEESVQYRLPFGGRSRGRCQHKSSGILSSSKRNSKAITNRAYILRRQVIRLCTRLNGKSKSNVQQRHAMPKRKNK